MLRYSNAQIVAELRRVYKAHGERPYSRREYQTKGKISKTTVENRFGSWSDALRAAKLFNKFTATRKKVKVQAKARSR